MKNAIKFLPNRVRRLYLGGVGIDLMRGDKPENGYYPEDWIASCVEGNTREFQAVGHGLSKVVGMDGKYFCDLLKERPEEFLGKKHFEQFGPIPAVLAKILDSAIRLPIQVHPTVADAKKYYNAPFGKTEAWLFLATQPGAYIYLGFNESFDEAVFRRESLAGKYEQSFGMMHKFYVKPGEVAVVFGGLPHAIGEGITMIEVMEPSDLTINPEAFCGDKAIAPQKRFGGLSPEIALDLFERKGYPEESIRRRCFQTPEEIVPGLTRMIDRKKVGFFEAQRLELNGDFSFAGQEKTFRVGVVVKGSARNGDLELNCGDGFFLPYECDDLLFHGNAEMIFLLPPLK